MSIQQRLMAREPLDSWSVREQLCLATAVSRNGDQNWMAVSRALRAVGDPSRPPDWYRQKACAAQYSALLEAEETPKRKKRTSEPAPPAAAPATTETSQEGILKRLTAERISELQKLMQDIKSQYAVLKDEVAEARSPATSEARVREMLSSVEAVRRQRERDQQRHALWLREREERRLRAEKARRPLVAATPGGLSPPASSPLLTSLLKNASATPATSASVPVTQVLHIPHPSTVIDTVSPSAGAPTLSMLLERGREGAQLAAPAPAPAPPAPNETAVIEHIKSQLQEIEHHLRLGNMRCAASPVSGALAPVAPATDKVDIDDIEIKAEDVYAFSDMDLEIPPVSTIHKSSLARCIEKGMFTKKEEEPESEPPAAGDPAPEQPEPKAEAAEAEAAPAEAEPPAEPEAPPEPEVVAVDDTPETSIPLPPEPVAEAPAEPAAEAEPAPAASPAPSPAPSPPPPPPPAEPPAEAPRDSPSPEDPIEAQMKEMHSEEPTAARERRDASPPAAPPTPPPPPPPPSPSRETAPEDAPPAIESVKEERACDETEVAETPAAAGGRGGEGAVVAAAAGWGGEGAVVAAAAGRGGEGAVEAAPAPAPTDPEHAPPDVKVKQEEEELEAVPGVAVAAEAGEVGDGTEPEETHTETDDDTPMEVIREEETEGRRRRDYSRRKTRPLSDSQACSGSESAAESAPASPVLCAAASPPPRAPSVAAAAAAATAPDPDRDHRLWKKSVMLVYNRLCAHKYASLFLRPITDEVAPGYSLVVRRPMDLHTIKRNMDSGVIRTTAQFQRDVLLMLSNALFYNNSRDRVHHMTQDMHQEAAAQLGMLLQAQAHAALADAAAAAPARRAPPHAKRKRTSSVGAAGSPAAKRPRDD